MFSGQPERKKGASDCPDLDHASYTENRMANATAVIAGAALQGHDVKPANFKNGEENMAKSQRKGNKEIRKPKKPAPPKPNASNPSLKGQTLAKPAKG